MKKIYLTGTLLASVLFFSCSDFLDKTPSTSLPVEEAITSLTDLRNAVNGIGYLLSQDRMTYSADYAIYADLKGEDFKALSVNNQAGPLSRYTITKNDDIPYDAYYYFYKALANVNKALSAVDNITVATDKEAEFNDYKGQLYAWRALLHFDLARMFCNAPTAASDVDAENSGIVLSTEVYDPDHFAARSTLKETYTQILNDFETALPLLSKDINNGHINYWAGLALRARVYLYNGNDALALADANAVIANTNYSLYTLDNYTKVWSQTYTSESLFELTISTTYNAQRNSVGYYCMSEGYGECAFVEGGELLTYLENHPKDVRSELINDEEGTNPGKYPAKYPGRDGNVYVNNPKIIRLSDVYLIAAEAALKTGGDAASYINTLRKNRIADYSDVNTVSLDDILFERRIELYAENSMAFDYWRNKKSITNAFVGEVAYNDYRTILPIPQQEIDIDPTVLIQNPEY
ncbi:MAG: RagB/SusD family nutrient uptake outer membrane protein [Bacteroidetes bacterium]|nr:RagB/SusD family nutrient uptake outer membrane protein [Bacteroidota bacterium]